MYHKGNEHTALDTAASPAYLMYENLVEQDLLSADRDVTCNFCAEREAEWETWVFQGQTATPRSLTHNSPRGITGRSLHTHTNVQKSHSSFLLLFPLAHCWPYLWGILDNFSVCTIRLMDSLSLNYCLPPNKNGCASVRVQLWFGL